MLVKKGTANIINIVPKLSEIVETPAVKGDAVGQIDLVSGEEVLMSLPVLLAEDAPRATFVDRFLQIIKVFLTV